VGLDLLKVHTLPHFFAAYLVSWRSPSSSASQEINDTLEAGLTGTALAVRCMQSVITASEFLSTHLKYLFVLSGEFFPASTGEYIGLFLCSSTFFPREGMKY
jgi:hypothetical protein